VIRLLLQKSILVMGLSVLFYRSGLLFNLLIDRLCKTINQLISRMHPAAYVYILTNKHHTVLYTGMTTDLRTRLWEHQTRLNPGSFSSKYNVLKPLFYEGLDSIEKATERELFIKGKTRKWKDDLIAIMNPTWKDLTEEIMGMEP